VSAACGGHDIDRPAFMESIFAAANEDRVERHEKKNENGACDPSVNYKVRGENASNPVIPSGAPSAPPGRRPPIQRVSDRRKSRTRHGRCVLPRPADTSHARRITGERDRVPCRELPSEFPLVRRRAVFPTAEVAGWAVGVVIAEAGEWRKEETESETKKTLLKYAGLVYCNNM
jgi:hypothetical protein